jgi:hypothetical protein
MRFLNPVAIVLASKDGVVPVKLDMSLIERIIGEESLAPALSSKTKKPPSVTVIPASMLPKLLLSLLEVSRGFHVSEVVIVRVVPEA